MGSESMGVFDVIAVDRRSCEIILQKSFVANSESSALTMVDLDPNQKKRLVQGEIIVAARQMFRFDRIVPMEVSVLEGKLK